MKLVAATPGAKGGTGFERIYIVWLATKITDVNGNIVNYNYDNQNRLTSITSSDNRTITLSYSAGSNRVSSVSANGKTWNYSYGPSGWNRLEKVTLPDGRFWQFDMAAMFAEPEPGSCTNANKTLSVTHPYGTTGSFTLSETRHWRKLSSGPSNLAGVCYTDPQQGTQNWPFFETMSVVSKTLSGPGVPSSTWSYAYEGWNGQSYNTAGGDWKWTEMTDPLGQKTKWYHSRVRGPSENLLMKQERKSGATVLSSTTKTYSTESPVFGATYLIGPHSSDVLAPRHASNISVVQDGTSYTTQLQYDTNQSSTNYSYGFPTQTTTSSSLSGDTKTEQTTYAHNKTKWVLGLPAQETFQGKVYNAYTYDGLGRVTSYSRLGAPASIFTYHTHPEYKGAVHTAKNADNKTATFTDYKRGVAKNIVRYDNTTISQVVDDAGRVTSKTDPNGVVIGYQYNAVGWPTKIDRPAPWSDTDISYSGIGTSNFTQTSTTGSVEDVTWYDAMLRPIRQRTRSNPGDTASAHVKFGYDGLGQQIFTSIPSTSADPTQGSSTSYDALGRVTKIRDTITGAETVTAYLSNGQVRTTDSKGNIITTTSIAYGSPDNALVTSIAQPMGLSTTMSYDTYGNMTQLQQTGSQNGYSSNIVRKFWYDGKNRLCRHHAPEFGDELFGYDVLDRVTQHTRGLTAGAGCAAPSGNVTSTTYDSMGRVTAINYPGSTPDISYTYDSNGNRLTSNRGGVNWNYLYNTSNLLQEEKLTLDGRTYRFNYAYTGEGFPSSATMPNQDPTNTSSARALIEFGPDGLGRPTKLVHSGYHYAAGGQYHVNGALSTLSLGNGQIVNIGRNNRLLTESIKVSKNGANALHQTINYDTQLPRVTAIQDHVVGGNSRSFGYDALNRLTSAPGPWGAGSFKYDALGNLRQKTLGNRTVDINYDSANRVSQAKDTGDGNYWRSYSYDARGNTTGNGKVGLSYDFANQPTGISGAATGSYIYDGNLKRVKQTVSGKTIYSIYSSLGGSISYQDHVTDGKRVNYLSLGGTTVRLTNGGAQLGGSVEYTHADHLGSPLAATTQQGDVAWREEYTPFGEARLDVAGNADRPGFTGHVDDHNSRLTYMQARYYDPVIGRFLSTDLIGYQDQLNMYAYVHNDPVNKTDPTGMEAERRLPPVVVKRLKSAKRRVVKGVQNAIYKKIKNVATNSSRRVKEEARDQACKTPPIGATLGADAYLGGGGTVQGGPTIDPRTGKVSLFGSVGVGPGFTAAADAVPVAPVPFVGLVVNAPSGITGDVTANGTVSNYVGGGVSHSLAGSSQGQTSVTVLKANAGFSANSNLAGQGSVPLTPDLWDAGCDEDD